MADIIEKRVKITKYEKVDPNKKYTTLATGFVSQALIDTTLPKDLKRQVYLEMCNAVTSQFIDWCFNKVHVAPGYFDIELNISENTCVLDISKRQATIILAPRLKGKEQITTVTWSENESEELDNVL